MRPADLFNRIKNRGFTLVEVIISIGFLCVATILILQLFIASGSVRTKAVLRENAALMASNSMEACRIADDPSKIGAEIFNADFTEHMTTDNGYVIHRYFGEDWSDPAPGTSPMFIVTISLENTGSHPVISNTSDGTVIASVLYEIKIDAAYTDETQSDNMLYSISSKKHFVIREGNDD